MASSSLDLDGGDLRLPGRSLRALRPVVAAAVGLVDRVDPFLLGGNLVAPLADMLGQVRGLGGRLGPFPGGVIFVGVHATAGGVDDQDALGPRGGDRPVHRGGQLADPAGRPLAPVLVPHVADDDRRLRRVPAGASSPWPRTRLAEPFAAGAASRTRACKVKRFRRSCPPACPALRPRAPRPGRPIQNAPTFLLARPCASVKVLPRTTRIPFTARRV